VLFGDAFRVVRGAAFAAGFDQVGEFVVGAAADAVQVVEGAVQRRLVAGRQHAVDQRGQLHFPEVVLDAAGGLGQVHGQPDQVFSVGALLGAAGEARAFHGGASRIWQNRNRIAGERYYQLRNRGGKFRNW